MCLLLIMVPKVLYAKCTDHRWLVAGIAGLRLRLGLHGQGVRGAFFLVVAHLGWVDIDNWYAIVTSPESGRKYILMYCIYQV